MGLAAEKPKISEIAYVRSGPAATACAAHHKEE